MAVTALMYHSLSDGRHPDAEHSKYTTRLATFREHLKALKGEGFQLHSVAGAVALCERKADGERNCVLTLDDGHRSSLDLADAMEEAGVRGTFFLTADYCRNRADFLQENDMVELARRGFDFGTHGVTHRPLRFLPSAELQRELVESKRWLEGILGTAVTAMSLPAGQGGTRVIAAAFAAGYSVVGNSREEANQRWKAPGELNRFVVLARHDPRDVLRIASAARGYVWTRRLRAAALWLPKRLLRPYHRTRRTT